MTGPALAIRGLTKRYGRRATGPLAVDALTLTVEPGTIFAFLGPNGAGKTTTLKLVLGLLTPTAGTAALLGGAITDRAIRARIGYLPEEPLLHPFLTVRDVLGFYGALFGYTGATLAGHLERTIALVGMTDRQHDKLGDLSKGLRQRVLLGQALINDPELLLLDEPQSGLDPVGMQDLRALMMRLKGEGKTIFLNSHQLTEVEQVADRIGIIRGGRLIQEGDTHTLLGQHKKWIVVFSGLTVGAADALIDQFAATATGPLPVTLSLAAEGQQIFTCLDEEIARTVMGEGQAAGGRLLEFQAHQDDLEDLFLGLMREDPA